MEVSMTVGALDYVVGDDVEFEDFGDGRRTARVIWKSNDIKNGHPGFDCVGSNGEQWWGYDYQIVRVVRRLGIN
jgi:hypothetical protein